MSARADPARRRGGLALVELLVAVALLGLGTASLLRLHLALRLAQEQARQRSEASRHAAADLAQLRWSVPATAPQPLGPVALDTPGVPTVYTLQRRVQSDTPGRLHGVATTVRWEDRHGRPNALTLATALTSLDPQLGAVTLLDRSPPGAPTPGSRPSGSPSPERSLRIPAAARDLGDGRHAFKPRADEPLVWLFDSRTGEVVGRCDSAAGLPPEAVTLASLGACKALGGLLLSGHIRFATDRDTLTSADAEQPASPAMSTLLRLGLTTTGHPSPAWECAQDGPSGVPPGTTARTSIAYHCVVQPAPPASGGTPRWSGRLDLVPQGWALASATGTAASNAGRFRVCRYSADHDGNGRIDNPEHPASHSVVTTALGNQNFLVIRAAARCPLDATPPIDDSTVAHQP